MEAYTAYFGSHPPTLESADEGRHDELEKGSRLEPEALAEAQDKSALHATAKTKASDAQADLLAMFNCSGMVASFAKRYVEGCAGARPILSSLFWLFLFAIVPLIYFPNKDFRMRRLIPFTDAGVKTWAEAVIDDPGIDWFQQLVTNTGESLGRSPFRAALQTRTSEVELHVQFLLYLVYEMTEDVDPDSPSGSIIFREVVSLENTLRALPAWKELCGLAPQGLQSLCDPGLSFGIYKSPTLQASSDDTAPSLLLLDGKGQDVVPYDAAVKLALRHGLQEVFFTPEWTHTPAGSDPSSSKGTFNVFDDEVYRSGPKLFRSAFAFTLPCCTTQTSTAEMGTQVAALKAQWLRFVSEHLAPALADAKQAAESEDLTSFRVWFEAEGLANAEAGLLVRIDATQAASVSAAAAVFAGMLHTGSPFLGPFSAFLAGTSGLFAYTWAGLASSQNELSVMTIAAPPLVLGLALDALWGINTVWASVSSAAGGEASESQALYAAYLAAGRPLLRSFCVALVLFWATIADPGPVQHVGAIMVLWVPATALLGLLVYLPLCAVEGRCNGRCRLRCLSSSQRREPRGRSSSTTSSSGHRQRNRSGLGDSPVPSPRQSPLPANASLAGDACRGKVASSADAVDSRTVRNSMRCVVTSKSLVGAVTRGVQIVGIFRIAVFVLVITLGVLAAHLSEQRVSLGRLLPDDHNQVLGRDAVAKFAPHAALMKHGFWAAPPPRAEQLCRVDNFSANLAPGGGPQDCLLFTCEVDPDRQSGSFVGGAPGCSCYRREKRKCGGGGGPEAVSFQRRVVAEVELNALSLKQAARESIGSRLPSNASLADALLQRSVDESSFHLAMVQSWETGRRVPQRVSWLGSSWMEENTSNTWTCEWEDLCFCGSMACKLSSSMYRSIDGLVLQADDGTKDVAAPPASVGSAGSPTSENMPSIVHIVLGIPRPTTALATPPHWVGGFKAADLQAQRDLYTLCTRIPSEKLRISRTACWFADFRDWLHARDLRFPVLQSRDDAGTWYTQAEGNDTEFHRLALQFADDPSSQTGGGSPADYLWVNDETVRGYYVSFEVELPSNMTNAEILAYRAEWDGYLGSWSAESVEGAKAGCWHDSELWWRGPDRGAYDPDLASYSTKGAWKASQNWWRGPMPGRADPAFPEPEVGRRIAGLILAIIMPGMLALGFRSPAAVIHVQASTMATVGALALFLIGTGGPSLGPLEVSLLFLGCGYSTTYSMQIASVKSTFGMRPIAALKLLEASWNLLLSALAAIGCCLPLLFSRSPAVQRCGHAGVVAVGLALMFALGPVCTTLLTAFRASRRASVLVAAQKSLGRSRSSKPRASSIGQPTPDPSPPLSMAKIGDPGNSPEMPSLPVHLEAAANVPVHLLAASRHSGSSASSPSNASGRGGGDGGGGAMSAGHLEALYTAGGSSALDARFSPRRGGGGGGAGSSNAQRPLAPPVGMYDEIYGSGSIQSEGDPLTVPSEGRGSVVHRDFSFGPHARSSKPVTSERDPGISGCGMPLPSAASTGGGDVGSGGGRKPQAPAASVPSRDSTWSQVTFESVGEEERVPGVGGLSVAQVKTGVSSTGAATQTFVAARPGRAAGAGAAAPSPLSPRALAQSCEGVRAAAPEDRSPELPAASEGPSARTTSRF